jgi:hypothetical protein
MKFRYAVKQVDIEGTDNGFLSRYMATVLVAMNYPLPVSKLWTYRSSKTGSTISDIFKLI